ncbi:rhodanese-like domain-containing protein [Piscinibacter sp.]|uniref:rhodanese-like domain-containing protein n=1 Tax=Piscinibacter sp. TaxID=1903157 RepID=UPI002CEA3A11|nr:rhodanese-like domain-containing protein [Albitalea sp.]HUG24738.1 rhodanese-like domain-containing protein [Albitalea sp.]
MDTRIDNTAADLQRLYRGVLGGDGTIEPGGLTVAFERDFGSFAQWQAAFAAMAQTPGWTALAWSPAQGRLVHQRAADDGVPLLAFEPRLHGGSVDDFIRQIRWAVVNDAYAAAVERTTAELGMTAQAARASAMQIVDVRRAAAFDQAGEQLPGAVWRDPTQIAAWADALDRRQPVLVYCVYGHEVGRSTALALRLRGVDAHFLVGGVADWQRDGHPMEVKS